MSAPIRGGSLAFYLDPPFVQATYAAQPCGCEIIGNGTIPHPLDVKRCAMHEASFGLLEALREIMAHPMSTKAIHAAHAAIAKAEGHES